LKRIVLVLVALLTIGATKPVDHSRTVTMSPVGAYVVGNPAAKVRLVEYMSYTCSHCAAFAKEGTAPLMRDYVARGLVAFEVRNLLLNGLDFTSALAARCGGPARFKGNHEAILAAQPGILAKGATFDAAPYAKNPVAGMKAWARASGLAAVMATRGVPAAALDKCIASPVDQARIQAMTRDAIDVRKLSGTPTFLIGDRVLDGNTWATVDADLRAALKL
jgi:protein-disulfide isomerase